LHACRDRHHAADAGGDRTRDHRGPLFGEIREVEMAVAVDQHRFGQPLSDCSTYRGKMGSGAGSFVPETSASDATRFAKLRLSAGTARRSSSLPAESGM